MRTVQLALLCLLALNGIGAPIGIFDSASEVGVLSRPGSVKFDEAQKRYTVTGGGSNMWFSADAFYFIWKKVEGDVSLAAELLTRFRRMRPG